MLTSTNNKLLIFFFLTVLLSLIIQIFLDFYSYQKFTTVYQLAPGIITIILLNTYEEHGAGRGMLIRRIIPSIRPSFVQILIALLPLLVFPVAFFLFKLAYNPIIEYSNLSLFALLFPLIGALAEELGWRGYLLNKAGSVMHIFIASVLTGFLWFFSRIYFYIDEVFLGITYMFLCVVINFILTYLFFIFNRCILLTYLFQLAYSYMFLFFTLQVPKDERFVFFLLLLFLIPALIIVLKNKKLFQIDVNDNL